MSYIFILLDSDPLDRFKSSLDTVPNSYAKFDGTALMPDRVPSDGGINDSGLKSARRKWIIHV